TAFRDALLAALLLAPAGRRGLVVAISDGWDNASWASDDDTRRAADASNAVLYLVTVAPEAAAEPPELVRQRDMAERTGGGLLRVRDFSRLEQTLQDVLAVMRSRY